jgi:hypothetical protein
VLVVVGAAVVVLVVVDVVVDVGMKGVSGAHVLASRSFQITAPLRPP